MTLLKMQPSVTHVTAMKSGKMKVTGNMKDSSFIYGGFYDATRLFNSHESSDAQKCCRGCYYLPKTTGNVGEMLSSTLAIQKHTDRLSTKGGSKYKIFGRQGIPLHGDGNERDSNFMQLCLHETDDPQLTSPQIQNELIKLMAVHVLRAIVISVQDAKCVMQ